MSERPPGACLTPGKHLAGVSLLALALGSLLLSGFLPTRGAAGLELPFLDEASPPVVVAFAGYPACGTVCPTSLALMGGALAGIEPAARENLRLLFINVERDTPAAASERYAQAFHPEFHAYSLTGENAGRVYRELSLASYGDSDGAAAHTGYVYVFARAAGGWRIERVYRRLPSRRTLVQDLQRLLDAVA